MARLNGLLLVFCSLWSAAICQALTARAASPPYAPYSVACPAQPLNRPADNRISEAEQTYINDRSPQADEALLAWLGKTLDSWPSKRDDQGWGSWSWAPWKWGRPSWAPQWWPAPYATLPRLSLALSGGGPKAGLIAAGVVQGLDSRDSNTGVSGLLQSMTYASALSGGSLTLTGVMVNDFATVSSLRTAFWDTTYQNPFTLGLNNIPEISAYISAKRAAGYPATLVDIYGLTEGYDFLNSTNAAVNVTWSSVLYQSAFQSAQAPFPLLTLSDTNVPAGQCLPSSTGPVWEVSPLEFGSWDPTVAAFTQTKYLGTNLTNGSPDISNDCTLNFDIASFLVGISTDILTSGSNCSTTPPSNVNLGGLAGIIQASFPDAHAELSEYGIVPNPFYEYSSAGNISSRLDLYMLDGGDTGQDIPIMPFLQPARAIDVIFAVDEGSNAPKNITNGAAIYNTYVAAQRLGLDNMPPVPNVTEQTAMNFSLSAHFLGCYNPELTTIVYLPDSLETQFPSSQFFFTPGEIDLVITEGTDIVTQSNSTEWPKCVACAIMHKNAPFLWEECASCLEQYCYVP